MAQIIVRDLDDDVKWRLQRRAKQHGNSMEAEVRNIFAMPLRMMNAKWNLLVHDLPAIFPL